MGLSHSPRIVTDGLVFCVDAGDKMSYPGAGTTWTDLSKNRNNGTLQNSPGFSSANGGSIVFDGANEYVSLTNTISLTDFTASAVFNASSLNGGGAGIGGWGMLFGSDDSDNFIAIGFYDAANPSAARLRVQDVNSNNSDLAYFPTLNEIVHLQVTQSGNNNIWYINGEQIGSSSNGSYAGMEITHLVHYQTGSTLGIWGGNYYIASLYNRALSPEEIRQNYNATRGRFQ